MSVEGFSSSVHFIAFGYNHSAAISNGDLYTWGSAATGKLGLGKLSSKHEQFCPGPTRVHIPSFNVGASVKMVSCGNSHTAAVMHSGEMFMWGSKDGGKLGLGNLGGNVHSPVLVKSLRDRRIHVEHVSCGCLQTIICSEIKEVEEGVGTMRVRKIDGGEVYVAGSAIVLGLDLERDLHDFELLTDLKHVNAVEVSAGYGHTAVRTFDGELYTWGKNKEGCTGHPVELDFIGRPSLVECLFTNPRNIALGKPTRQSSTFAGYSADFATDQDRSGDGASKCAHTLVNRC
jgi:alpha-tubulin suppressor-like RCC1 family protein